MNGPPGNLDGFTRSPFSHLGKTRDVFRIGSGPAVVVLHEIPGITPTVAAFARRVAEAGFTAVCPVLVGTPGLPFSKRYAARSFASVCISREFNVFVAGKTSPVVTWLRALAQAEHASNGGPGVGVVGMCFSGGFALAMAADPVVIAPVMSQPSLPIVTAWRKGNVTALDCSAGELAELKGRMDEDLELCVVGYRFSGDALVPKQRFARLEQELGDRFVGVTFDSSPGNPNGHPARAHSVLTEHLVESAAADVIALFQRRLRPDSTPSEPGLTPDGN